MTLRNELIQVAAVAVAIVEDLDYGQAKALAHQDDPEFPGERNIQVHLVLNEVDQERLNQDRKWGPQHHTPEEWLAILAKEVGEAAGEVALDDKPNGYYGEKVLFRLRQAEAAARIFLRERFGPDPQEVVKRALGGETVRYKGLVVGPGMTGLFPDDPVDDGMQGL